MVNFYVTMDSWVMSSVGSGEHVAMVQKDHCKFPEINLIFSMLLAVHRNLTFVSVSGHLYGWKSLRILQLLK